MPIIKIIAASWHNDAISISYSGIFQMELNALDTCIFRDFFFRKCSMKHFQRLMRINAIVYQVYAINRVTANYSWPIVRQCSCRQ